MTDDTLLPFALPSVQRKKITAAFDGGRISSDGGVMLLGLAERRIGVAEKLAAEIADPRDPTRVVHSLADILRARILAIACGYEDADDLDHLRSDPALKLACGHLPDSGRDLCSQPTMSRWENAPTLREVIRLMRVMVALYCSSYDRPPAAVTLDIDDTLDVVHGGLSGFPCAGGHSGPGGSRWHDASLPVFLTQFSTSFWPAPTRRRHSTPMAFSTI